MTKHIGYHFTSDTLRDGSPIPPIGEKLVYEGEITICKSGFHWSRHSFDALQYAPGEWLHLVECSAPVEEQNDKCVSKERTILATIDATHLLRRFTADQALSVSHLWDMPDVVREYMTTLDEDKRVTAWNAAMAAVSAAARDVARDAAMADAMAAARDVAWDAASAAAWNAAMAAASAAAWEAAWNAASAAASAAAWEAGRADFQKRVDAAFEEVVK